MHMVRINVRCVNWLTVYFPDSFRNKLNVCYGKPSNVSNAVYLGVW